MNQNLQFFVDQLPVVDVHEHHMPEIVLQRDVNLLQLFQQSYAGWTLSRPYCLPSETRDEDPMMAAALPTTWDSLLPYLEGCGSNAFVRNLVRAITELHGDGATEINSDNWQLIDQAVRSAHQREHWLQETLQRARIQTVITDDYTNPLLDPRKSLGAQYRSVMRINCLALGWHPRSADHNGNRAHELLSRLGRQPESFDDYLQGIRQLVDTMQSRGQVALKNALAYDRSIDFDEPDEGLARTAWGQLSPSPAQKKAFGDFVVNYLCQLAGERDIPMQLHLGTGIVRGSHPMLTAGLIERHPRTRFLLMHLAYPWSRDLLGMAFVYRNIWLDLSWSFLLSPSHFKLALHEAIDVLPDESRMMLGGDNWHVDETYGAIQSARRYIAEVLQEKIDQTQFPLAIAQRLAKRILYDNAVEFFKL